MKRITQLMVTALLILVLMPISSVSAYNGGLLDGKTLNSITPKTGNPTTTTNLTDDDINTYFRIAKSGQLKVPEGSEYTFESPMTITAFKLYLTKPSGGNGATAKYYDASNNLIYSNSVSQINGVEIEHEPVKGVVKVQITGVDSGFYTDIREFNVYGYDENVVQITDLTAEAGDSKVILNWSPVSNASNYNVYRSTTPGGPYQTVTNAVYGSPFIDLDVVNGTAYYYVVTAVTPGGESAYSNEASATPQPKEVEPSGDRALLTITLTTGLEKEYDLPMEEINAFINWYDAKDAGSGPSKYAINKHNNNKGPFIKRTDYVIFNNILTFEVNEYSTVTSTDK